ncbi:hypothetical protein KGP36_02885 [Patescibacteria group bacterium]|nr:hypothetical protein [Patescibacteria group bacterium]
METETNLGPYQVDPFNGKKTNIVFLLEYVNSRTDGNPLLANTISNYCLARRAAGFRVIISDDWHTNFITEAAGQTVKAFWTNFADAFVELDRADLQYDTFTNDVSLNIHPGPNGWQIIATNVAAAVKLIAP